MIAVACRCQLIECLGVLRGILLLCGVDQTLQWPVHEHDVVDWKIGVKSGSGDQIIFDLCQKVALGQTNALDQINRGKIAPACGMIGAFIDQVQAQFNNQGSDIGAQLSALFSAFSQLSTNPASIALRQGVLTAAGNLASTISNTANNLQ